MKHGPFEAKSFGRNEQDYCVRCGYSLIYILAFKQKCDKDRRPKAQEGK